MSSICLSGDLNLIYVHIPKTAGVSISNWLIENRGNSYCEILRNHPTLEHIKKRKSTFYETIGDPQPAAKNPFTFASVRNPWARTWSAYQNICRHRVSGSTEKQHAYDVICELLSINGSWPDFKRFVQLMPELTTGVEPFWNSMTPQIKWIYPGVDLTIRVEHLEEDFCVIQKMFNVHTPLPVLNTSEDSNYQAHYNDETKKLVGQYFEIDIDTWKYTFND